MSTQTSNEHQQLNKDELYNESTFHPWQTVIRGRSTCTANAYSSDQKTKSQLLKKT